MARIVVDEIVSLLSFESTKKSKDAIKRAENSIKSIKRLAQVSAGALASFAFAMNKIIGSVDKQAKFADGLGVTFENLQKIQFAGQKAGASISEVNSAIETLTKTMSSTKPGEFNAGLQQLGISVVGLSGKLKPASQLLLDISDALAQKDPARRQQFGARLGFSTSIVNFLAQGSKKILADMREAEKIGGVIPERLKVVAAALFDDSFLRVKTTIKGFSSVIALSLAPQLIKVVDSFEKWTIANKKFIATNIGKVLSGFVVVLKNLKIVMIVLSPLIIAWAAAIIAAAAPLLALGAAIAVVVSNLDKLKDAANSVSRVFGQVFPSFIGKTIDSIKEATTEIKNFFGFFKSIKDKTSLFTIFSIDKMTDKLNEVGDLFDLGKTPAKGGTRFPILQGLASGASNTTSNDVVINVNGAQSPREVGIEVKKQFDLSTAVQTSASGFNRPRVA